MSSVLSWFLIALIVVVPVVLCLFPGLDDPRSDDPPDTGGDAGDPGLAILPLVA